MNILNFLKTKKAKTLFLIGLMGFLPSCCKTDENAPDDPTTQNNNQSEQLDNTAPANPIDSFMQHMPNVDKAVFYEPTEDTHCFVFHTDNNANNVIGVTELRDMKDRARYIYNPYELTRIDNTCVDGSAKFITPAYWVYHVEYANQYGAGDWMIDCVTDAEYKSKYLSKSSC